MADSELTQLKAALAANQAPWRAEATAMSALDDADFLRRLGAEPPPQAASLSERVERAAQFAARVGATEAETAVPAAVDWHAAGGADYLGAVRDQGSCGSCVAFGSIAAIEGCTRVASKKPALAFDLSEAHLFYCHGAAEGRNCGNGWWPDRALAAAQAKGIVDEACFPYTAGDQACRTCSDAAGRSTRIKGWKSLSTAAQMQAWLAEKGPLVACFTVYEDFRHYRAGIYRHVSGAQLGGHCVCIVGYSNTDRCWIARNSWGPGWGEGGYFRIGFGEAGIDYEMWAPDVDAKPADDVDKLERALITGLWVNAQARQAQCYVDKLGWRKLGSPEMLTLAATAKSSRAPCTLRLQGDTITEIYVL